MNFIFVFIASFFILGVCWITPLAGTDAAYENQGKPFAIIAVISVILTGLINTMILA